MYEYWVELAEKELKGPFKRLKIEIVRQSMPAVLVCGSEPGMRQDPPRFSQAVVTNTNYQLSGFVNLIPQFILQAIIIAVVQWLIKRWLDHRF